MLSELKAKATHAGIFGLAFLFLPSWAFADFSVNYCSCITGTQRPAREFHCPAFLRKFAARFQKPLRILVVVSLLVVLLGFSCIALATEITISLGLAPRKMTDKQALLNGVAWLGAVYVAISLFQHPPQGWVQSLFGALFVAVLPAMAALDRRFKLSN